MKSYVEQREAELKLKYATEMWWIHMSKLWDKLGKTLAIARELEYYQSEYNKIRSEYVRKGRPLGYSPKKKEAA